MAYLPLPLPPGVYRNGTKYQAKGRWYDSQLVRWHEGAMLPWDGWFKKTLDAGGDVDVLGPARGMIAWRDNSQRTWFAAGTPSKAFAFEAGVLTEITPVGFTAGLADSTLTGVNVNYGANNYGQGPYGGSTNFLTEAQTWQFDTFGQLLVAMAHSDGKLYSWDLNLANDLTVIANAPVSNLGLVVTPEHFLVALGAGGDGRLVKWADQESLTLWTPDATNQAGDFPLASAGVLLAGRRTISETLLWTTKDVWVMRFIGGTLVYSIQQKATGCGAISRMAMATAGANAYWMSQRSFFVYDGFVRPIPSDVGDFVFNDLNYAQAAKIWALPRAEFGSVTWFYPSATSAEIDRYVEYNYLYGTWAVGSLQRTAGVDREPHDFPMMIDAAGKVYDHDRGASFLDPAGVALVPSAESGPVEIGRGDRIMDVLGIVPDDKTVGDVTATFFVAQFPGAAEVTKGPFTLSEKTDVRFSGRQIRVKVSQVNPAWRVGVIRLDAQPGDQR